MAINDRYHWFFDRLKEFIDTQNNVKLRKWLKDRFDVLRDNAPELSDTSAWLVVHDGNPVEVWLSALDLRDELQGMGFRRVEENNNYHWRKTKTNPPCDIDYHIVPINVRA